ncbi:MAG: hypothetical protein AAF614_20395 [Chloroflexota bacterium]
MLNANNFNDFDLLNSRSLGQHLRNLFAIKRAFASDCGSATSGSVCGG